MECSKTQFGMVWDRYGDRCIRKLLLHHDMATTLADLLESVACKNRAYLFTGEDAELTQR